MNRHLMETGNAKFGESARVVIISSDGFYHDDELLCPAHAFYILRNTLVHASQANDSQEAIITLMDSLKLVRF